MSAHRSNSDISELVDHFNSVIDWINSLFDYTGKEVRGLPWGAYYRDYHSQPYDRAYLNKKVNELLSDPFVHKKNGIFKYLLGGEVETQLLEIRVFDSFTKEAQYKQQTRKMVCQIVLIVLLVTMLIKTNYGKLKKWMPIM